MSYDTNQLRRIIEGAVLAAGEALSLEKLQSLFEEHEAPEKSEIKEILQAIAESCEGHGYRLVEVASGWRFQVREDIAPWVNRLWEEKPQKYSRAMLETLALIAYRQPITRGDIEDVRGVAVSSHIIKTLVEREWVKVVGHRDVPGKPSLYATTRQFLDYFNLKSLDELPSLSELKDIDGLNGSLDFEDVSPDAGDTDSDQQPNSSDEAAEEAGAMTNEVAQAPDEAGSAGLPTGLFADGEVTDEAPIIDTDAEDNEVAETLGSDTLAEAGDERVPVQEAEIPLELDDDVVSNSSPAEPLAEVEPTVEQEEFEAEAEPSTDSEHDSEHDSDDASDESSEISDRDK